MDVPAMTALPRESPSRMPPRRSPLLQVQFARQTARGARTTTDGIQILVESVSTKGPYQQRLPSPQELVDYAT